MKSRINGLKHSPPLAFLSFLFQRHWKPLIFRGNKWLMEKKSQICTFYLFCGQYHADHICICLYNSILSTLSLSIGKTSWIFMYPTFLISLKKCSSCLLIPLRFYFKPLLNSMCYTIVAWCPRGDQFSIPSSDHQSILLDQQKEFWP